MTDKQKIERLAKWMGKDAPDGYDSRIMLGTGGRYYIDTVVCAVSKDAEPEYRVRIWTPLTNITDAWMLVEKWQDKYIEDAHITSPGRLFVGVVTNPASVAAREISETVLERIA